MAAPVDSDAVIDAVYRAGTGREILRPYDRLERAHLSPVVRLNRAAAVARVEGPERALALVDAPAPLRAR